MRISQPRRVGTKVLGSVAVFRFLVQAFSGVLLSFNYAPTPGEAYNRLKYILTELTGGSLIRGLHHCASQIESAPDEVVAGAAMYQEHKCSVCHTVNGSGMAVGPPLNGLSRRQASSWVEVQIRKPGKHKAESVMPSYDLNPGEMTALVSDLMALLE